MNHSQLFYSIWRNQYISSIIRNKKFENKTIRITASYLNENYQFLSLLDTNKYDIYIKLHCLDRIDNYLDVSCNYIVNALNIYIKSDSEESFQQLEKLATHDNIRQLYISFGNGIYELNFSLPSNLVKLHLHSRRIPRIMPRYKRKLPHSLKELIISDVYVDYSLGLPDSLTSLFIRHNFGMRTPKVYPPSLKILEFAWYSLDEFNYTIIPPLVEDLKIVGRVDELEKFQVSHDKVYKNATLKIYNQNQLSQLHNFKWVSKVNLLTSAEDFDQQLSFCKAERPDLSVFGFHSFTFEGYLPSQLEKQGSQIQFFSNSPKIQLIEGMFPNNLQVLELPYHKTPLAFNILPKSLTELDLSSYTIPINDSSPSMSIPQGIKKLTIGNLSCVSPNSLPNSITDLCITEITSIIDKNILSSMTNIKKLKFKINMNPSQQQQQIITLPTNSITDLSISYHCKYRGFHSITNLLSIPSTVHYLTLINIKIEQDLIPNGCFYLLTNYFDNLERVLPPSIKRLALHLERCFNEIIKVPPQVKCLLTPHQVPVNIDITINERGVLYHQKKNIVHQYQSKM